MYIYFFYRGCIGEKYWESGKENGNYYNGLKRVEGLVLGLYHILS